MNELTVLLISAASLGFVHTLLGPDHYLPFIVLSKARKWSQTKTMWITLLSGIGHVGGSVVLGITGVAMGISLTRLESIEASRAEIVAWMLIVFGFAYTLYGVYKFLKNGGHRHVPSFLLPKSVKHMHLPNTDDEEQKEDTTKLTPWILFLIFVFGPCEVLIPLLIYPAAEHDTFGVLSVASVFGFTTVLTMLTVVLMGYKGFTLLRFKQGEKYVHGLAGLVILFAGIGMKFLGW